MKITLPLPPNMANSRMHWRTKHRERRAYLEDCGQYANFSGAVARKILTRATITATIYHTHTMDQDNAMARLKWPVDWLVSNLWIQDDDPDHLIWTGLPTQVKCKKDERRVEFVLEAA